MKRSLLFIFTLLTITLSAVAQPRISSNKETHHFGQIEWKRPVSVEYTITNTGDKPLVLTNVTTSCACSVANWTKTPIAPGEKERLVLRLMQKRWGISINRSAFTAMRSLVWFI